MDKWLYCAHTRRLQSEWETDGDRPARPARGGIVHRHRSCASASSFDSHVSIQTRAPDTGLPSGSTTRPESVPGGSGFLSSSWPAPMICAGARHIDASKSTGNKARCVAM